MSLYRTEVHVTDLWGAFLSKHKPPKIFSVFSPFHFHHSSSRPEAPLSKLQQNVEAFSLNKGMATRAMLSRAGRALARTVCDETLMHSFGDDELQHSRLFYSRGTETVPS